MRRRVVRAEGSEINMTPMLDVVFIMLIFFIVTASFLKESGIDLSRYDAASTKTLSDKKNIVVSINSNGQVWIEKRPIDLMAVRANIERLHAENPEGKVLISADRNSKNGVLVKVIDAARLAGVYNVSLVAPD